MAQLSGRNRSAAALVAGLERLDHLFREVFHPRVLVDHLQKVGKTHAAIFLFQVRRQLLDRRRQAERAHNHSQLIQGGNVATAGKQVEALAELCTEENGNLFSIGNWK